MKALGLVVSGKKIFENYILKPIRTIWTISVRDLPGTIPIEFGQIPINGSREEVVCSFPYIIQFKNVSPMAG